MAISALEYTKRLTTVSSLSSMQNITKQLIDENEGYLIEMKEEEYKVGNIYSSGERAYYSNKSKYYVSGDELYSVFKHKLNPLAGDGIVDLILTGSFVNSFILVPKNNGRFLLDNTNYKKNKLIAQYDNGNSSIMNIKQSTFVMFQVKYIYPIFTKRLKQIANIG